MAGRGQECQRPMGTGEWHRKEGKTSERDVCLLPVRLLPGVSVILFLVSGKAGAYRDPHPDDSTISWAAWMKKGLGFRKPKSHGPPLINYLTSGRSPLWARLVSWSTCRQEKGQARHRWTATFVPSSAAQQATAALARGRCSALSGIHCGLRATAGTGFQTKYGAPAQASPHLQA